MSEPVATRPRLTPRRVAIAALLSAGVAIAITFWVSNAGLFKASECAPQSVAAQKIDAVAVGQLAALNGTGTGRGYSAMKFTDARATPKPSRISPARPCWSISGRAGASPAAPRCRRSTSSRRPRTATTSWCCRSTSISATAASTRPGVPRRGPVGQSAALRRLDLRGLQAAPDLCGRPRSPLDAADRQERLRTRASCRAPPSGTARTDVNVIAALKSI